MQEKTIRLQCVQCQCLDKSFLEYLGSRSWLKYWSWPEGYSVCTVLHSDAETTRVQYVCIPFWSRGVYDFQRATFHRNLAFLHEGFSFNLCCFSSNFSCQGQVTPTLTDLLTLWFPVFWALQSCRKNNLSEAWRDMVDPWRRRALT